MKVKMEIRDLFIFGSFCILTVSGQCVFQSPWASSTWLDSTRGTLTFGTTTLTGWSTTVFNQVINSWTCVDNSSSTTLVMKSATTITYTSNTFYAYLCMKLTQITTNSYTYVQQQVAQPNAGYERLRFSQTSSLSDVSVLCDTSASIPTLEFHVLVKNGMGDSAAIAFPNSLLFSADYQYRESDGTVACNDTSDTMDMCTDTKALSFNNYPNCNQQIAYSAGGELWCVATASLGSYDCAVVFNRDATISGTASQFACLCSDGSSVSVVSGNCTSDQTPSSFPTDADGTTAIGYRLIIETVYVNCAPSEDGGSSSSNVGLIAGIVVVLLIIIAVIIVSIILYKRGYCVGICGSVNGCLEKTPCWATCRNKICVCCKNKVAESEKPMLANGAVPHVETINETSRPRTREKTAISAITRASSVAGKREKSELEKSLIRQGTTASITGIDIKSARSSVQQIHVKSQEEEKAEEEPRLKLLGLNLSFLVCCPEKKEEETKTVIVDETEVKPPSPVKKKPTKGAGKKGAKGKGAKGTKGGKKEKKSQDKQTEKAKNDTVQTDTTKNDAIQMDLTKSSAIQTDRTDKNTVQKDKTKDGAIQTDRTDKGSLETDRTTNGAVQTDRTDKGPVQTDKKKKGSGKTDKTKNGAVPLKEAENGGLTRAPTKMKSDLRLTSTPVPGGEKGQKGVVSVPAGLLKPENKPTEWTFLSCCFGKRSPPPEVENENTEEPESAPKKKSAAKPAAKAKGGGTKKSGGGAKKAAGKKGGGKGGGKKKDANENDVIEEDLTDETPAIERAKTMPERQKTTLSLQDAEKIKVDVYVPDDKTNLQLKDTVTVIKGKKGEPKLEKAKTDIGATRPGSSRPASSMRSKSAKGKSDKTTGKKADKGKDGGKKGSKDKKGGKKKKK